MPAKKLTLSAVLMLCVIHTAYPQRYRPDLLSDLVVSSDANYSITGKFDGTFDEVLAANAAIAKKETKKIDNRVVVNKVVNITLQKGTDAHAYLNFEGIHFQNSVVIELEDTPIHLHFINCRFERKVTLRGKNFRGVVFENNVFDGSLNCELTGDETFFTVYGNQFYPDTAQPDTLDFYGYSTGSPLYENSVLDTLTVFNHPVLHNTEDIYLVHQGEYFSFSSNKVFTNGKRTVLLKLEATSAQIQENQIEGPLHASGNIADDLVFTQNELKSLVSMETFNFPISSKVDWSAIIPNLAVTQDTVLVFENVPMRYAGMFFDPSSSSPDSSTFNATFRINYYYTGRTKAEAGSLGGFKDITFAYKKIFDFLKSRGDSENANKCFVAVKDLERIRLKTLYHQNPSFASFFRLQLNRIMKFYTNHATDPARALVISSYIICFFAVIYFFFPSDWDINSKSRLISNFKTFIEKNDKGYFKPLLILMGGFFLSALNALTLSLNAFVTLGFGNIPTHGAARYVCVMQGFIGWFLLSIFTVALFNQVLF